jgi:hypothetical protein
LAEKWFVLLGHYFGFVGWGLTVFGELTGRLEEGKLRMADNTAVMSRHRLGLTTDAGLPLIRLGWRMRPGRRLFFAVQRFAIEKIVGAKALCGLPIAGADSGTQTWRREPCGLQKNKLQGASCGRPDV